MESDGITDEQISFSSRKRNDTKIVRLHHTGTTWIADKKDINPWLQVDLRAQNTKVTRVATQGSHQKKKRVKKYKLQYSNYGVRFQNYKEQGETISKVKLIRGSDGFLNMSCSLYTKPSSFLNSNFPVSSLSSLLGQKNPLCNESFVTRFVTMHESAAVQENCCDIWKFHAFTIFFARVQISSFQFLFNLKDL